MVVNSGVKSEQKDIYGLAHFCEHMVLLGSKKYPNPSHFKDFITSHGGKSNGYTDLDTTGFYFTINPERFTEAIDIFAQFIIDSLFSSENIESVVSIVNSEFERNIQLDAKSKEMILKHIANPESLFHRFTTGNTDTLLEYTKKNKIDLRERVYEFYKKNYRPDNMKLIVYGNQPIEYYKELIEKSFKDLNAPKAKMDPLQYTQYNKLPWEFHKIGKLILYKTISSHQKIDIFFMIEDIYKSLPDNSALYFKTLINYKGKGSLDDNLRRNGYVAGIKGDFRKTCSGFSLFKITGYATTKGIEYIDKVISIIFEYLKFLKVKALDKSLYDYTKKVYDIAFYFSSKKRKKNKFVKEIGKSVWNNKKKYWFSGHKILDEYNEENIKRFGEYLTLSNSIVMVGNKNFKGLTKRYSDFVDDFEEGFEYTDPFYKTEYSQRSFKQNFIQAIDSSDKKSELEGKTFLLFANKKSLPGNISLLNECKGKKKKVNLFC